MLNLLLRFFLGVCQFDLEIANPARLLSRLQENGIYFYRPRMKETTLSFRCMKKSAGEVDDMIKALGVTAVSVKGIGMPFLLWSVKARVLCGILILLFVVLPILQSFFVADITISGNRSIDKEQIMQLLSDEGVHRFSYIPGIDLKCVRQQLLLKQPKLSWAALNLNGNCLEIILHEKKGSSFVRPDQPCNIVAACDGILCRLDVLTGQEMVKGKTAVKKGELLVSGFAQSESGALSYYHAQATAIAEVSLQKSYTVDFTAPDYLRTGREIKRYALFFWGNQIPLYPKSSLPQMPYTAKEEEKAFGFFGVKMPFGIGKTVYALYETVPSRLTKTDAREILTKNFAAYEANELTGAAILAKQYTVTECDGKMTMTGDYLVQMDIAKEVKIGLVEDFYENKAI